MSDYLKKHYPSKGEFPTEKKEEYIVNVKAVINGQTHYFKSFWRYDPHSLESRKAWEESIEWWLDDLELPSDKEIDKGYDEAIKSCDSSKLGWLGGVNWLKSKLSL